MLRLSCSSLPLRNATIISRISNVFPSTNRLLNVSRCLFASRRVPPNFNTDLNRVLGDDPYKETNHNNNRYNNNYSKNNNNGKERPMTKMYQITMCNSYEEVLKLYVTEGKSYSAITLQTSINRISKLCKQSKLSKHQTQAILEDPRMKSLMDESFVKINELDARGLANLVHSFVALNITKDSLPDENWTKLAENICEKANDFNPQDISNTVYAYGKLGINEISVFEAASEYIQEKGLNAFNSQAVSNSIWAFATVNIKDPLVFEAVNKCVKEMNIEDENYLEAKKSISYLIKSLRKY